MALLAIGLEIALHFSNQNLGTCLIPINSILTETGVGWPTLGLVTTDSGFMHFVYVRMHTIQTLFTWLILR